MLADSIDKAPNYAADVDAAGNLYFAAPILLPGGMFRIYRVNPGGDDVSIVTAIPDTHLCDRLICGESGLYAKISRPYSIVKFDYDGNEVFSFEWINSYLRYYVDGEDNLYLAVNVESEEDAALIATTPDALDHDYSGGADIVIQKYDPVGNLLFSSFLGGSDDDFLSNLKIDHNGVWYLYLYDTSIDFPCPIEGEEPHSGARRPCVITISPGYDVVHGYNSVTTNFDRYYATRYCDMALYEYNQSYGELSKFSSIGEIIWTMELLYETPRFGTYRSDYWREIPGYDAYDYRAVECTFDVDTADRMYIVRNVYNDVPYITTSDALYPEPPEAGFDFGIWQVTDNAELLYGTYFGGSNIEETAMNAVTFRDGKLYVTGYTNSPDFPLTPGAYIDSREPEQFNWGIFAFCIDFNEPTEVAEESAAIPEALILDPPHPNPFNPATTISFTLSEAGFARLAVYNISGQLVRELAAEHLQAGRHEIVWDGRDANGAQASSGVYIARLATGDKTAVRKVTLVR